MLDHPDFIIAKARIDSLVADADRWRFVRQLRRSTESTTADSTRQAARTEDRTLAGALVAFGAVVGDKPTADARTTRAMRTFVAHALEIAEDAGIHGVPSAPSDDAPAIVIARTAGLLAARAAGTSIELDVGTATRLQQRLAAVRLIVVAEGESVPQAAPQPVVLPDNRSVGVAA